MARRYSSAMTATVESSLAAHLVRDDGQEDLCFASWRASTGRERQTVLVIEPILPEPGERHVHGNASFEMSYALRAAKVAAKGGDGIAFIHSHPKWRGWQRLNGTDRDAEASIANLAREITGLPLVGLTLATGDNAWSSRVWDVGRGGQVGYTACESVRTIGSGLRVTFNDDLRPPPRPQRTQRRTIHAWGDRVQADLTRLRVLVVGAGSVGLYIVESLARTGIEHIAVMDYDRVEFVNLDRLHAATALDAALRRPKVDVARRILRQGATAEHPRHEVLELSVCEPAGMEALLDFDVVFACADRPWPRHVLNTVAYADLIPVVEGGLRLDPLPGGGLRNAVWRSQVVTAGRPCLACIGQYDPAHVQLERDGSLDNPAYIAGLPANSPLVANQNVSALSIAAASAMLNQFLSLTLAPGGLGDPGPLRHDLALHRIRPGGINSCIEGCPYQGSVGMGHRRLNPSASHEAAELTRIGDGRALRLLRSAVRRVGSRLDIMAATIGRLAATSKSTKD
jgi:molybdopterin-synthase adenylyltransferase